MMVREDIHVIRFTELMWIDPWNATSLFSTILYKKDKETQVRI